MMTTQDKRILNQAQDAAISEQARHLGWHVVKLMNGGYALRDAAGQLIYEAYTPGQLLNWLGDALAGAAVADEIMAICEMFGEPERPFYSEA